ncbi:MAG TPA: CapA family protein [Anaeromyxobacteraceae bacterium]|nr:CapA family protein [Anaeromyxobacteraceae bacterium]
MAAALRPLALALLAAGCASAGRTAVPPERPGAAPRGGALVPVPPAEPPVAIRARATLGAVGDVLMHGAVKESARVHGAGTAHGGYSWLYAAVADLLAQPDLTFANLETPVAPDSAREVREFLFSAPAEAALALRDAGVDVVAVANNHAFDQGRAGFEETLRRLQAAGLRALGAGPTGYEAGPVRIEVSGLSIAFLSYAYAFNQEGNGCPPATPPERCLRASVLVRDRALEEVRAAASSSDAVVVSLHWGVEYAQQPRAEDVEYAHRLADAGALVILGHHPHVLQPVEIYPRPDGRVAVIAYSLGNFISNQERRYVHGVTGPLGAARDGVLLRVALARRDYGRGVERVEVAGADWLALWTENDTAEIDPRRESGRKPAIRVVSVDRALAAVRAEMAAIPDPVPTEMADRWVRLRQREALYLARRAAAGSVLGEELARTLSASELAPPAPATAAPPPVSGAAR